MWSSPLDDRKKETHYYEMAALYGFLNFVVNYSTFIHIPNITFFKEYYLVVKHSTIIHIKNIILWSNILLLYI